MSDARKWVLWGVLLAGTLTAVSQWTQEGRVSAVVPTATWALAVLLTLLADLAPRVATGLAVLILASSTLVTGPQVWEALTERLADAGPADGLTPDQRGRLQQPDELRDQVLPPNLDFA